MSITSRYIYGKGGTEWQKVGLIFQHLGFTPPRPEEAGKGAFGMNIANQYHADLSQQEVYAILQFACDHTRRYIEMVIRERTLTMQQVMEYATQQTVDA